MWACVHMSVLCLHCLGHAGTLVGVRSELGGVFGHGYWIGGIQKSRLAACQKLQCVRKKDSLFTLLSFSILLEEHVQETSSLKLSLSLPSLLLMEVRNKQKKKKVEEHGISHCFHGN